MVYRQGCRKGAQDSWLTSSTTWVYRLCRLFWKAMIWTPRICSSCLQEVLGSKKLQWNFASDVLVLSLTRFRHTQKGSKKSNILVECLVQGWAMSDCTQELQVVGINHGLVLH